MNTPANVANGILDALRAQADVTYKAGLKASRANIKAYKARAQATRKGDAMKSDPRHPQFRRSPKKCNDLLYPLDKRRG